MIIDIIIANLLGLLITAACVVVALEWAIRVGRRDRHVNL